jgi:hypothetical protein
MCTGHVRFQASRKQVAAYQFEVHHYAGPVEYTTDGFVEKNRDELPKESIELLNGSNNPFVMHMSEILTDADKNASGDGEEIKNSSTPYKLRRSDSSLVSRMTVGGQFQRQLKDLRSKIDKTSPHYIRCLKPNDHLVPDHFEPAIVAEQLRCGGILEAVRVSRAGFTQHYPHADFVRRYRGLAAKELAGGSGKFGGAALGWTGGMNGMSQSWHGGYGGVISTPSPPKKWEPPRHGVYSRSQSLYSSQRSTISEHEEKDVDYKALCKNLLKVLSKKIQSFEAEEAKESNGAKEEDSPRNKPETPPVAAKAKSYTYQSATPPPSWTKSKSIIPSTLTASNGSSAPATPKTAPVKARYQPWAEKKQEMPPPPPRTPSYRRGADVAKVGIQVGKTKVFLRHKAFEILERLRSQEFTSAANKLNSIFRMYLCRIAYIPIRDAYREELRGHGFFNNKEHKEEHPSDKAVPSRGTPTRRTYSASTYSLIEQFESQIRSMIHNKPLLRSEWGKAGPNKSFKWMLEDGLWVKNPAYQPDTTSTTVLAN